MHSKTNLLVQCTRSSVCYANLILGFSVNYVHKKHLAECYLLNSYESSYFISQTRFLPLYAFMPPITVRVS